LKKGNKMKCKFLNIIVRGVLVLGLTSTVLLQASSSNFTWVNFTVKFNDITLEDLAATYYGDVQEAKTIYNANRAVLGKHKRLCKGMRLKLPVTEKFRDQPEYLGWN
jgi:hypothetical protein